MSFPLRLEDIPLREAKEPDLVVTYWASGAFDFLVNTLTKYGIERQPFSTTGDRLVHSKAYRISGLPLQVGVECASITARRGSLYVAISLRLGQNIIFALIHDYLSAMKQLSWPPGTIKSSVEEPGLLRSITGTDPAAGSEVEETVPTNARWRLNSLRVRLVTSADTGNRRPRIRIDDGTNLHFQVPSNTNQVASTTRDYAWIAGAGYEIDDRDGLYTLELPSKLLLFQGWKIRVEVQGMFAADNLGPPQMMVEEWIEE